MFKNLITRFCRWWLEPKRLHRCRPWFSIPPIPMSGQMVRAVSEGRRRTHYFCRWCGSQQCENAEVRLPARLDDISRRIEEYKKVITLTRAEVEELTRGPLTVTQDMLAKPRIREGGTIG